MIYVAPIPTVFLIGITSTVDAKEIWISIIAALRKKVVGMIDL